MAFGAPSFRTVCPQIPMAFPASSSSSSSSSYSPTSAAPRRAASTRRMALPQMPSLNPKDTFLSKLATVAASAPEALAVPPSLDSDTPPFLDIFDSPRLMATPAHVKEKAIASCWFLGDNVFFFGFNKTWNLFHVRYHYLVLLRYGRFRWLF